MSGEIGPGHVSSTAAASPPPQSKKIFVLFKYILSWILPNHMYNLCRIA